MRKSKKLLISYCGICCSFCPAYKSKGPKRCPGCFQLYECKIVRCARKKKIKYCFSCKKFPCNLFVRGFEWDLHEFGLGKIIWKPFSDSYIKMFRLAKRKKI